ncbi:MAG TPA: hypothetical protein VKZ91_00275 [Woeseiaceae bacterium]|nr:hypothetical protein [Woeseiaceae bacterium]
MFETQAQAQLESFRHIIQRSAKSGQQAGQNADDPPLMFGQSKLLGIRVIAASRAFNNSGGSERSSRRMEFVTVDD